jgi:predicted transcriptional regulator
MTGLRQPEVSIAVKYLRSVGWLSKSELKKDVKGRPVHVYRLALTSERLVAELEKIQKRKIDDLQMSLAKLREEILG